MSRGIPNELYFFFFFIRLIRIQGCFNQCVNKSLGSIVKYALNLIIVYSETCVTRNFETQNVVFIARLGVRTFKRSV